MPGGEGGAGGHVIGQLQAHAQQAFAGLLQQVQPGVLPLPGQPGPERDYGCHAGQRGAQQLRQRRPADVGKSQLAQQVELAILRVVEYPVVPAGVGGIPEIAHALQAALQHAGKFGVDGVDGIAHRTACLQAGKVFYPAGRDGGGWVDAHPAFLRQPDFSPGVGIALAHGEHAVHGVEFAALVAGNDACGNVHIAHQHHKSVGNVFAKALLAVEPEHVGCVLAREAWRQGIGVAARAQALQHGSDLLFGAAVCQSRFVKQLPGQFAGARVQARRQREIRAQIGGRQVCVTAVAELAAGAVAQHVYHGALAHPFERAHLQGAPACGQGRSLYGNVQREQPLQMMGLQQHFVAHLPGRPCGRGSGLLVVSTGHHGKVAADPFLPFESAQHRAAKVQVLPGRQGAVKTHAKGDAVVLRQLGDVAHGHVVAQAGFGAVVGGQPPQRGKARKQHEQRQHDGRAQGRHAQRNQKSLVQRRVACGHVGVDQGREQGQHAHHNARSGEQRLREEEMAQQREKAQKKDHEGIAPRLDLERFEREQQQNQRAACFAPHDGAKLRGGKRQRQQQQANHQPA